MGKLILLRHGESLWNKANRFTGWTDVDLTDKGRSEAKSAGKILKEEGLLPDMAFTSFLKRAIYTQNIVLAEMNRFWIPERKSWRLNERHYGALQGKNKKETAEEFGDDQVHTWRRSFDVLPPALAFADETHPHFDDRYAGIHEIAHDFSESLETTIKRTLPYLLEEILPLVHAGKTVLVTAHGNSLRGIVKYLEELSDTEVVELNIPTGVPYVYNIDEDGKIYDKRILSHG